MGAHLRNLEHDRFELSLAARNRKHLLRIEIALTRARAHERERERESIYGTLSISISRILKCDRFLAIISICCLARAFFQRPIESNRIEKRSQYALLTRVSYAWWMQISWHDIRLSSAYELLIKLTIITRTECARMRSARLQIRPGA